MLALLTFLYFKMLESKFLLVLFSQGMPKETLLLLMRYVHEGAGIFKLSNDAKSSLGQAIVVRFTLAFSGEACVKTSLVNKSQKLL